MKHNNAMGRSENTVAEVNLEDEIRARVLHSVSDSTTTSGQARSSSGFTVAEAQAGDDEVKAVDCAARSVDTHGTEHDETGGTLLAVGDEGIDDPGLCELFVGSDANHQR